MNVFDFAMAMEDSGYEYYQSLATAAKLPGLKAIFADLAEDERKHFEIFRALKAGQPAAAMPESKTLAAAQNLFAALPKDAATGRALTGTLVAYQHAMQLEADSFRFYEEAAAKEPDAGVKALLLQIAGEEYAHFNILENVYNFVNAPNLHLEWGEFSNLGEFRQFGRKTDS